MNPVTVTYTTTGAQAPIALDYRQAPFQVSYLLNVPGGVTTSFTFDYTLDNVNDPSITPVWVASSAIIATTVGALSAPVQFVRLNIASLTGGGVTLKILQASNIV